MAKLEPYVPVVDTLLLDEQKVAAFLNRCAAARLAARDTSVTWQQKSGSNLLDTVYGLGEVLTLGLKVGPGFAEVNVPSRNALRGEAREHAKKLFANYQMAMKDGTVVTWLSRQRKLHEADLTDVRKILLEARQINEMVDQQLQQAIFAAASVKFAAEIALLGLGGMPFGALAGVVTRVSIGIGYPVLCCFISDWNKAPTARLVLSVGGTAVATGGKAVAEGMPSLMSEGSLLEKFSLEYVDKKFEEAKKLLADAGKARRMPSAQLGNVKGKVLGEARKQAAQRLVQQSNAAKDAAYLSRLGLVGLKAIGPLLQVAAIGFMYKGAQESAKGYWDTLAEGGL